MRPADWEVGASGWVENRRFRWSSWWLGGEVGVGQIRKVFRAGVLIAGWEGRCFASGLLAGRGDRRFKEQVTR